MSEHTAPLSGVPRTPATGKLLAALAVALLLVAGVFFLGRLADDPDLAMGLTAVWFGLVLGGGYLVGRRRSDLRLPMAAAFGVVAAAVGVLVGLPTIRDKEVNERVVTGTPASQAPASGRSAERARPTGNVQLASGSFRALSHAGTGTAAVVEVAGGERKLTLTGFETDSGPDLRLYVSTRDPAQGGELGDFEDLGALKGNKGNQQYALPASLDIDRYSNVVVWCRAFSVGFTSAALRKS